MKYLTNALLIEAIKIGEQMDFNRQLIENIPNEARSDRRYPVELFMIHRHRHGEQCEPHARVVIELAMKKPRKGSKCFQKSLQVVMDMSIEFFNALPGDNAANITDAMLRNDAIRSDAFQRTLAHVCAKMKGQSHDAISAAATRHLRDLEITLRRQAA